MALLPLVESGSYTLGVEREQSYQIRVPTVLIFKYSRQNLTFFFFFLRSYTQNFLFALLIFAE